MGDNEPHTNGVNGGGESDDEVNISTTIWCLVVMIMKICDDDDENGDVYDGKYGVNVGRESHYEVHI